MAMKVSVLFFAGLRERLGVACVDVELPADQASVGALRDHRAARGAPWPVLLTMKNLRVAVNQQMVGLDAPLQAGDEVAFFPPVTGG
jgi:molybdopterin synthase sulfur carrier subunit